MEICQSRSLFQLEPVSIELIWFQYTSIAFRFHYFDIIPIPCRCFSFSPLFVFFSPHFFVDTFAIHQYNSGILAKWQRRTCWYTIGTVIVVAAVAVGNGSFLSPHCCVYFFCWHSCVVSFRFHFFFVAICFCIVLQLLLSVWILEKGSNAASF